MIEINSKVKEWGNSLGVIIPKEIARKIKLKSEERVRIMIERPKSAKVKDIFGIAKFKKKTKQMMKELDKELDIRF